MEIYTFNFILNKAKDNPDFYKDIPELSFISDLGREVKKRGCFCGLGPRVRDTNIQYGALVRNMEPDLVTRLKKLFNLEQICFNYQSPAGIEKFIY